MAKYYKVLFFLCCLLPLAYAGHSQVAQINDYTFSTNATASLALDMNGNPIDMDSGTSLLIGPDNICAATGYVPIGFDFYYMGLRQARFCVTTSAVMALEMLIDTNKHFMDSYCYISVFNDVNFSYGSIGTGPHGKVHSKVVGTKPYRTLVVEWKNMSISSNSGSDDATFQVRLYETTGVIEYVYGEVAVGSSTTISPLPGISYSGQYCVVDIRNHTPQSLYIPDVDISQGPVASISSTSDSTRRAYRWTPPPMFAPLHITFSQITNGSMRLEWQPGTYNHYNFYIYMSNDGIDYQYFAKALDTFYVVSDLLSATNYYWGVSAVRETQSLLCVASQSTLSPSVVWSVASGNWNNPAIWSGGQVPDTSSVIRISDDDTVTLNISTICNNLIIGTGTGGVLQFERIAAQTLSVRESVTINSGGIFRSSPTGNLQQHYLKVGKDLINYGTMNFSCNNDSSGARVLFNTKRTGVWNMAPGSYTRLKGSMVGVTISKPYSNSLTMIPNGTFTVQGGNNAGFLSMTSGMLHIMGDSVFSSKLFASTSYTMSGTLWLDNPKATIEAMNGTSTISGTLRISAGTYNAGITTANSLVLSSILAQLIVEGGRLNVSSCLRTSSSSLMVSVTGGSITLGTAGNSTTYATLYMPNAWFIMSGGEITLVNKAAGNTQDYFVTGHTAFTGGRLNIGSSLTTSNSNFKIGGNMPSIVIDSTGFTKQVTIVSNTDIFGDVTIPAGASVSNSTYQITVNSNGTAIGNIRNNGQIIGSSISGGKIVFNGKHLAQTYYGSGTFGHGIPYYCVGFNNPSGVVLLSTVKAMGAELRQGQVFNSGLLKISDSLNAAYVKRGGDVNQTAGTFDSQPLFQIANGQLDLTYLKAQQDYSTGFEVPSSRTIHNLNLDLAPQQSLTLSGGPLYCKQTLILSNGFLRTDSVNLLVVKRAASGAVTGGNSSSYVMGPLARTMVPNTQDSIFFPVGKSAYSGLLAFHPVTGPDTVLLCAEVVDGSSSGICGAGMTGLDTTRYWKLSIMQGAFGFTSSQFKIFSNTLAAGNCVAYAAVRNGIYEPRGGSVYGDIILSDTISKSGYLQIGYRAATLGPGLYIVGNSAPVYHKLTDVAAMLNATVLTGDVVFELQPDYDGTQGETFPVVFMPFASWGGNWKATIRPAVSAVNLLTTGVAPSGTSLIKLDGVDRLNFDGRPGGTGVQREWTFRNLRSTNNIGPVFHLVNGATQDTLRFLQIEGQGSSENGATVLFGASTRNTGNSETGILFNRISGRTDTIGALSKMLLLSTGSPDFPNNGNTISGNSFHGFSYCGLNLKENSNNWLIGDTAGSNGNDFYNNSDCATKIACLDIASGNNIRISGNSIYQVAGTIDSVWYGIYVHGTQIDDLFIDRNNIGGANSSRTGSCMAFNSDRDVYGIYAETSADRRAKIARNHIANMGVASLLKKASVKGIYIKGGYFEVSENVIGGADYTGVPSDTTLTGANTGWLYVNLVASAIIDRNIISNCAARKNEIKEHSGIYIYGGITIVKRNIVSNISSFQYGINSIISGPTGICWANSVRGSYLDSNIIHNIYNTDTNYIGGRVNGIIVCGNSLSVKNNIISNLWSKSRGTNSLAPVIRGIFVTYANRTNLSGNRISLGLNSPAAAYYQGINVDGYSEVNCYFNSVYIGGASTDSAYAACLLREGASESRFLNNLLYMDRTGPAPNACFINEGYNFQTNWNNGSSDYNAMINLHGIVGSWGGTSCDMIHWNQLSGSDLHSSTLSASLIGASQLFADPVSGHLEINPAFSMHCSFLESKGDRIDCFDRDYENDIRPGPANSIYGGGVSPDIGADEIDAAYSPEDGAVDGLVSPEAGVCLSNCEPIAIRIRNSGSTILDFGMDALTISGSVAGPNPINISEVINSGTLAPGSMMTVIMDSCYNASAGGTYTFNFQLHVNNDVNYFNDSLNTVIAYTGGTVSAVRSVICVGDTAHLQLNSAIVPLSVQWQESTDGIQWNDIPGADSTDIYQVLPVRKYFRVKFCGNAFTIPDTVDVIPVAGAPVVHDTVLCGRGVRTLGVAGGTNNTYWFTTPSSVLAVNQGPVYTLDIQDTTDLYISNFTTITDSIRVGPYDYSIGASNTGTPPFGVSFRAYSNLEIKTLDMFPASAGRVRILIEDLILYTIVDSVIYNVSPAEVNTRVTVPVHKVFPRGGIYSFTLGSGSPPLYFNQTGYNCPYVVPDVIYFTYYYLVPYSGYYYFYNLDIKAYGCESQREKLTAWVLPSAPVSITASNNPVCLPDSAVLTASSTNTAYQYSWSPSNYLSGTSGAVVSCFPATSTTYHVNAQDTGGCLFDTSFVILVATPPQLSITTANDTLCSGESTQLTAQLAGFNVTVGHPDATNTPLTYPAPYGNANKSARHQFLLTASELHQSGVFAGTITSVSFNVVSTSGSTVLNTFSIGIGNTNDTVLNDFLTVPSLLMQSPFTPQTGINTHTLVIPFVWNGTSNIVVETCFGHNISTSNCIMVLSSTGRPGSCIYKTGNNGSVCNLSTPTGTSDLIPQMIFGYRPSPTYLWTPNMWLSSSTVSNPVAMPLSDIEYHCAATDPATQCIGKDTIHLSIYPAINLNIIIPADTVCSTSPPLQLLSVPPGGIFSGTGIQDSTFDPAQAGSGLHMIYCSYTDSIGCITSDTTGIFVSGCMTVSDYGYSDGTIIISPNPGDGDFEIVSGLIDAVNATLVDATGRLLRNFELGAYSKMKITGLTSGVYILRWESESGVNCNKIVVY